MAGPIRIAKILRYPVKGLSGEEVDGIRLIRGAVLPGDRRFALATGSSPRPGAWLPPEQLVTQTSHPRLAMLHSRFDPATGILAVHRNGRRVVAANLDSVAGRAVLSEFFAAFLGTGASGRPRLVEEGQVAFHDHPRPLVSLVGSGTLAEVERLAHRPVGVAGLRINLLVDGVPAWRELAWIGSRLRVGNAVLRVAEALIRHRPLADPATGRVDTVVPLRLAASFGHRCLGVLAEVVEGGEVQVGDGVEVI